MSELDDVFARFRDNTSPAVGRRELRSVPQRGTPGTRVVEVVHVRTGTTNRTTGHANSDSTGLRAASWDNGFPARSAPPLPSMLKPEVVAQVAPTFHVMPPRSPLILAVEAAPAVPDAGAVSAARRGRGRPRKQAADAPTRHVADPFDPADDGANCMRCGYVVEPPRDRRGLVTCARCG